MLDVLVKETFVIVVGKQAGEIVESLDTKKYTNEFIIAKKMDLTINQVRNILYRLSDHGLVSSTRKKDKRKGWYTYFWKIEDLKTFEFLKEIILKKMSQINNQIKNRETKNFYVCERCSIELSEENAILYDFTCDQCGDIFTMKDNTKVLNEFNKNLDKLKKKLQLVNEKIDSVKEVLEKKKARELAKEAKEKEKKKEEKKKERKKIADEKRALKKKEADKTEKKKIVKKKEPKKKSVKKTAKKKAVKKIKKK
jgi:transcription initiation factor TFIIE subunit alpha